MPGAGNLSGAHAADKDITLPFGKAVTGIKRHTRDGNRRHPEHYRRLEFIVCGSLGLPWSLIGSSEADDGPAVVTSGLDDVDLVASIRTVLVLPDVPGSRMNRKPESRAMADRVNLGLITPRADQPPLGR